MTKKARKDNKNSPICTKESFQTQELEILGSKGNHELSKFSKSKKSKTSIIYENFQEIGSWSDSPSVCAKRAQKK